MSSRSIRGAGAVSAVALAAVLLGACSFRGSVTEPRTSTAAGPLAGAGAGTSSSAATTASSAASASASRSGSSGGRSTPGSTGASTAAPDRCHTSELTGSIAAGSPGAGQRYATLALRNTGGRACTVHGYGGLGLVGAEGSALPTRQVRTGGPAVSVLLQPGATVRSHLHWSAVAVTGDATSGPCQPSPTTLRVIPPDETDPLSVGWRLGPVCAAGTIDQQPYTG